MKRWLPGLAAAVAVLLLCGFFAGALLVYTRPMGAATYDLTADQAQWAVFTQEGDRRTELTFDGSLGYTGLSAPGQTFYYARPLAEEVENPVLTLDTVNRSVAVFLDGEPLYTDCPEQTGGIGALALPMLGWDRPEPVEVALPEQLPIPDSDLCPLLMNLLENALEANEKAPEGADKWLRVTMHVRGEYLYVGVENALFAPVRFDPEERLYRSTKSDGLHGLGLRSARAIARKYQSELVLEVSEGVFSASTALLLPEVQA